MPAASSVDVPSAVGPAATSPAPTATRGTDGGVHSGADGGAGGGAGGSVGGSAGSGAGGGTDINMNGHDSLGPPPPLPPELYDSLLIDGGDGDGREGAPSNLSKSVSDGVDVDALFRSASGY